MVLKKYVVFDGRSRRKEYWMFALINLIISIGAGAVGGVMGAGDALGNLYSLAVLLPSIAVGIRRMHDVGKSGWFILIPIYNIILAIREGDKGDNEYGEDPKDENTFHNNDEVLDDHLV